MPSFGKNLVRSIKGNGEKGEEPEEFAESYMKDDGKWIFAQEEMSIEDIRGEDVEKAVQNLKETAGGLDQWDPADLKLLSKEACRHLATFFDMIEKRRRTAQRLEDCESRLPS